MLWTLKKLYAQDSEINKMTQKKKQKRINLNLKSVFFNFLSNIEKSI